MQKRLNVWIMLVVISMVIMACSSGGTGEEPNTNPPPVQTGETPKTEAPKVEPPEPVKLVFYGASRLSEAGMATFTEYVQRKYPHISFEHINNEGDNVVANIVATKTQIDIMLGSAAVFNTVSQFGLLGDDISDLVKKHNFDLDRIEESYLDLFRSMNDGKLSGLPYYDLRQVLYYNKDIFDKFAESYPEDGMTWDETIQLARKLTVSDGGVQYRGFAFSPTGFIPVNQFSAPFLDPATLKATLQTDLWKKVIETYAPLYTMSGYNPTKELLGEPQNDLFIKEQTAAMLVNYNSDAGKINSAGINWDAVTLPEVDGLPGVGSQPYPVYVSLTSIIKPEKRDAAFLVMEQLLSEEIQTERSKQALATPLKSEAVRAVFGQEVEVWKGKNINAVTSQTPAQIVPYTPYNRYPQSEVSSALVAVILGEKDVNTALRDAEEQADKRIEANKQ